MIFAKNDINLATMQEEKIGMPSNKKNKTLPDNIGSLFLVYILISTYLTRWNMQKNMQIDSSLSFHPLSTTYRKISSLNHAELGFLKKYNKFIFPLKECKKTIFFPLKKLKTISCYGILF